MGMRDEDFFPDCVLPTCSDSGVHQHVLTHQREILHCATKYLYCQGGVGSAKSVAFAARCVKLSLEIPENVGVVCRKDFKLLYKTSWKDVKDCISRLIKRGVIDEDDVKYSDKRQGDYTTITFSNGSVIYAVQTKNWSEGLGASYGFFWVDDAMETSEELFVGDETSVGLISRLRLPHVMYHRDNGSVSSKLSGMVSSNPPPVGHWLHKLFGTRAGVNHIGDDACTVMIVATHQNPFVGAEYAKGLMAVQAKLGRGADTAKRVIFGESIPAYGGVKVFPQFRHELHVGEFKYDRKLPVIRAWDFGFHHPAVVLSHLYKCKYGTNHYITIGEVAEAFSLTIYQFYDNYVKPYCKENMPDAMFYDCGDKSGYRSNSANKDGRSDAKVLVSDYKIPFKYRYLDLKASLQYMRALLQPRELCQCGMQTICIDKKCEVLIGALEGGYKYPKSKATGHVGDKPVEDRYFADVACAWRYGAENFVKWGIQREQQQQHISRVADVKPWSWLEMSDRDVAALLTGKLH